MKLAWEGYSGNTINEARAMEIRLMGKDLELQKKKNAAQKKREDAQRRWEEVGRKKSEPAKTKMNWPPQWLPNEMIVNKMKAM